MGNNNNKITPEEFYKIINTLSLEEIKLKETVFRSYDEYQSSNLKLSMVRNYYKKEIVEDTLINDLKYTFTAQGEEHEKPYFKISTIYRLSYSCDCDIKKLSDDFYKIFLNFTLEIIVWPYIRELIQSFISKMNLPPLVLPIKKAVFG